MYNVTEATIYIKSNDDANGVFRFSGPYEMEAREGDRIILGYASIFITHLTT